MTITQRQRKTSLQQQRRNRSYRLTQKHLRERLHYDPETGVFTWCPRPNHAYITIHRKRKNLGFFVTAKAASKIREAAAQKYFGEFARGEAP